MRRARSRTSAQARAQLSSRARHVARSSLSKMHIQVPGKALRIECLARKRPHARDWQRASKLLIERPDISVVSDFAGKDENDDHCRQIVEYRDAGAIVGQHEQQK